MFNFRRFAVATVFAWCCMSMANGQDGAAEAEVAGPETTPQKIIGTNSRTAQMAMESLDAVVEFGEIKTELGTLGEVLMEKLPDVPIFVDERAVEMATLSPQTAIEGTLSELPLRSALRRLLRPHGLRVVVEQEGLVITADFSELTRRGIATDQWVRNDSEAYQRIHSALDQSAAVEFAERMPLKDAVAFLSEKFDIPMIIDSRALEEIGLTTDVSIGPLALRIKNTRLRNILRLILRQLDLTYLVKDEVLQITTIEAAEQNLVNRIYFLEGTGFPIGDFQSVIDAIQTTIVPDTWESLGGPSTMAPITTGVQNRPAVIVSTINEVHEEISALMDTLRRTHVGPDPWMNEMGKPNPAAVKQGGFF